MFPRHQHTGYQTRIHTHTSQASGERHPGVAISSGRRVSSDRRTHCIGLISRWNGTNYIYSHDYWVVSLCTCVLICVDFTTCTFAFTKACFVLRVIIRYSILDGVKILFTIGNTAKIRIIVKNRQTKKKLHNLATWQGPRPGIPVL